MLIFLSDLFGWWAGRVRKVKSERGNFVCTGIGLGKFKKDLRISK